MFTSTAAIREVSSSVVQELSQQIQQLRSDILNGHGKCPGPSHGHETHDHQHEHSHLLFSVPMIKLISESLSANWTCRLFVLDFTVGSLKLCH